MRVGLTYNLKDDLPASLATTRDAAAEDHSEATVGRVRSALERCGHEVSMYPFRPELLDSLRIDRPDVVFNIAEGWQGRAREALVPAVLEFLSIPYTGSDPVTLGACLDKALTKRIAQSSGIPTAPFVEVVKTSDLAFFDLSFPVFVKPSYEGSSKGITDKCLVADPNELRSVVEMILRRYGQPVLIEEFLPGREFTVGILGNCDQTQVFPSMEIRPRDAASAEPCSCCAHTGAAESARPFVYCYDTKVNNGEELLCPASISEALRERLEKLSVEVARVFKLRDLSRIDFRIDRAGQVNLLEINPLPGFSEVSLYPLCAKAAGLEFDSLVEAILAVALKRHGLTQESVHFVDRAV